MTEKIFKDDDVTHVLKTDGVSKVILKDYENLSVTKIEKIKEVMGDPPWAVRIVYNEAFGGVLICQNPGEGNRLHYHPDADECWVIIEGEWEWFIDGVGLQIAKKNDIVLVQKNTKHQIKCIGKKPAIRFAITKPDVMHTYTKNK